MGTGDRVAVFDFCETLIKFQTADAFINYVLEKTLSGRMKRIDKGLWLFCKLGIPRLLNLFSDMWERRSLNKRWRLYGLKGIAERELNDLAYQFYLDRLRPNIIEPVLSELKEKKEEGYTLGIVSGGFDIYIRYFAEEFGVDFYLSGVIGFKHGVCTGTLVDEDCMRERKVEAISRLFTTRPAMSISYSYSLSDRGVVVSRNSHQEWIDKYKFSEIIWQQ